MTIHLLEKQGPLVRSMAADGQTEPTVEATHKPIWERIQEISAMVPEDVWDTVPTDLAEQHDHYLYGTPKRTCP